MKKIVTFVLPIILLVVLVLATWWYWHRSVTAHNFFENYSYGDSVSPEEFCSLHGEHLAKATSLKSPAAYIAKSRNRATLEKWQQQFLVQENIDNETFQKNVRLISDEVKESKKDVVQVYYLLLRDWYALPLFVTINSDGTYLPQYPENPAYRVQATLAPLSCQQALEKIAPAADAELHIQNTADYFNIYSEGDSCRAYKPYTRTLLSLVTGEIVSSTTKVSGGSASIN